MAEKKTSEKVLAAGEKYLTSLGSSREQLTDKQWGVVVKYVKGQRITKLCVAFFLIVGLICADLSLRAFRLGSKGLASVIPNEVAEIILVFKAGEESMLLKPDDVKDYINAAAGSYWLCGACFVLAVSSFALAFISLPLGRRLYKKMFEGLIPRKGELETTCEKNSPSPQ